MYIKFSQHIQYQNREKVKLNLRNTSRRWMNRNICLWYNVSIDQRQRWLDGFWSGWHWTTTDIRFLCYVWLKQHWRWWLSYLHWCSFRWHHIRLSGWHSIGRYWGFSERGLWRWDTQSCKICWWKFASGPFNHALLATWIISFWIGWSLDWATICITITIISFRWYSKLVLTANDCFP